MAVKATITYKPPIAEWQKFFSNKLIEQGMREELNATGRVARTKLRRSLAAQTLIPYGEVSKAVTLRPAYKGNLSAVLKVADKVPTLGRFMTSYRLPPKRQRVSRLFMGGMPVGLIGFKIGSMRLSVWAGVQQFPVHSPKPFVLDRSRSAGMAASLGVSGGRSTNLIVVRTGSGRRAKLKVLSGPNLAGGKADTGEIQRGPTRAYVQIVLPTEFAKNVERRMARILGGGTASGGSSTP